MASDSAYFGRRQPQDTASDYLGLRYLISQMLAGLATANLVKVLATFPGGTTGLSRVSVQVLVNQQDGLGNPTPHGTIFKMPVWRLLSGDNAVILDPTVGDIGLAVFCSSDISQAVATMGVANPGSFRKFDWADGIYLGGLPSQAATQFIEISDALGIVLTPNAQGVTINGNMLVDGNVVVTGTISGP